MLTTTSHPSFQTPIDNQIDGITVNADTLIVDLTSSDRPLLHIAQAHKLSLAQLTVWYSQPAVRAMLDALDELANRRADSTAAHARHAATMVLQEHATAYCETPRGLELAGKAARTLYRKPAAPKRHQSKKSLRFPLRRLAALSTQHSAPPPHPPETPASIAYDGPNPNSREESPCSHPPLPPPTSAPSWAKMPTPSSSTNPKPSPKTPSPSPAPTS